MEWQPIETAPKDGTGILLGGWFDERGFVQRVGCWDKRADEWQIARDVIGRGFSDWMPLPPPPAKRGAKGSAE